MSDKFKMVDRGWQDMEQILDVSMPVKKKKKRLAWIFLFMLGALVFFGVVNKVWQSDIDVSSNIASTSNESLSNLESETYTTEKSISNIEEGEKATNLSIRNKANSNPTIHEASLTKETASSNSFEEQETTSFSLLENKAITGKTTSVQKVKSQDNVFLNDQGSGYEQPIQVKKPEKSQSSSIKTSDKIYALKSLNINQLSLTSGIQKIPISDKISSTNESVLTTTHLSFDLGLSLNKIYRSNSTMYGADLGLTYDWNNKFYLSSRIGYYFSELCPPQNGLANSSLDNMDQSAGMELDQPEFAFSSNSCVDINTTDFAFLLGYNLTEELSFQLGPQVAYNWGDDISDVGAFDNRTGTFVPLLESYSHWNWGLRSGLSMKVYRGMNIGLEHTYYQNHISNLDNPSRILDQSSGKYLHSRHRVGFRVGYQF